MKPIGVGVVGCGYWGPNLVRNFQRTPGAEVIGVCDTRRARAEKIAADYRLGLVTEDPAALVASPEIKLVVIATPSFTHYELAKAALEAGKHVLVMKPLTTTVADGEELVELASRQGLVLGVDHTFVYTGAVTKIKSYIAGGELGDIFYIDSVRINLGLFQSDVNVVWDLAPHDVSIIDYLLDGELPHEVAAVGARHAGSPKENIAYVTMRYGDRVLAHVHVNWLAPAKVRRTIVGGARRMIIYDDVEPSEKVRVYDKGVTISPDQSNGPYALLVNYRSGDMHAPQLDNREALAHEAEHVLECIRTGGVPRADGQAGLRVVRILEAAQRSINQGGVPVDLNGHARGGDRE